MKTKLFILLSLVISSSFLYPQKFEEINKLIQENIVSPNFRNGQWSVYAEYTDHQEKIIDLHSEEALAPASCLKLVTTSAALNYLGEDFKYETKLYYDGTINTNGILNGNIFIVGSGDPTLGSDMVKGSLSLDELMKSWVQSIIQKGIKKISGSVIADDFLFDHIPLPDNWFWVDIGNYYGAGTSALCINNNLYYLFFKPAKEIGGVAKVLRTEPEIPGLHFDNFMKTGKKGSGDNGYIYCAPEQYNATLRGTIPAEVDEFSIKGSIPDPPLFAAQYLTKKLEENKIKVSKPAHKLEAQIKYDEIKKIISTFSPPLRDIVYVINKRSNNLYTEQLLKTIAKVKSGTGSFEKGTEINFNFLKENGIPTEGVNFSDGSGLSRTNSITTKAFVKLLTFNTKQTYFNSFYNSLGVAGDNDDFGYFKNYGAETPIAKNARIKDGLIQNVRSHSGYIKSQSGRLIAFSFISNNYNGTSKDVDGIHLKLMIELAKLP
ncbi:MAG: D-alanyl-D-alanine carboxypeptidase/D-alanyl-D-alanine-endopeptidase [Ignavibacteriales bacterium]|nr:D-alanyl-D-alanine carboxypeptidase/D-alanyl-D-alanine-endopeptidase [Ignavibacteriales bacterium]